MLDLNEARGAVLELPQNKQDTRRPVRKSAYARPRPRPVETHRGSAWQSTALFSVCALLMVSIGLGYQAHQRAAALEIELRETVGEMQEGMQQLKADVNFGSTRQQLLLGMRDEILRVNEDISLGDAYQYAEMLLGATDKYPSVDPVLLLSVGIVESRFEPRARSHADARGLYQIWPSTGRMLSAMLGWEYADEMLYDAHRNTEMAALYLDVLMTTYNDVGMALAEYNGGPINAGFYRARSHKAAAETRDYVPKVLEQYERLVRQLPTAPGKSYDIMYRDATRPGKRLVGAKAD
jgi:hypothetical protein